MNKQIEDELYEILDFDTYKTYVKPLIQLISDITTEARIKGMKEIVNIAIQRAKDDDMYQLDAFAEDMDTYLKKLKAQPLNKRSE